MRRSVLALLFGLVASTPVTMVAAAEEPVAVPSFIEETARAGLDSRYMGDWEFMVGGGVATFDCSGDAYPDVFLSGGTAPSSLFVNRSSRGGDLRFEKVVSGLEMTGVTGAYPLDIDGDGTLDLVLLRVGENIVMRGLGGCRFERANEAWGFDGGNAWTAAFAATFERGAEWPTLAVGNYIDRAEEIFPWGTCTDNWLHRPATNGSATERRFAPPLPLKPSHCALSMLFTDWNRSGTPSLRISNDREYYKGGQEQLWHVEPGKPPALYTEAEGWKSLRIWGMGIASADLDLDGYPEYFLTSMADNRLQLLADTKAIPVRPTYKEAAWPKGVTAQRPYIGEDLRPSTAWHTQFEDVNNDGFVDLFIAKGNVAKMPDFAAKDPNNLLLQKPDGKFMEAGDKAGVASTLISRGAILSDLNLDGLIDMVVVNRWEPAQVWRNTSTNAGRSINVALSQAGANRNAIGAWVEVRVGDRIQRREITVGGGHVSGHLGWIHFGIGTADEAAVRVLWPDGETGEWATLKAESFTVLDRASGARGVEIK